MSEKNPHINGTPIQGVNTGNSIGEKVKIGVALLAGAIAGALGDRFVLRNGTEHQPVATPHPKPMNEDGSATLARMLAHHTDWLKEHPASVHSLEGRADIYMELGKRPEAAEDYRKALEELHKERADRMKAIDEAKNEPMKSYMHRAADGFIEQNMEMEMELYPHPRFTPQQLLEVTDEDIGRIKGKLAAVEKN